MDPVSLTLLFLGFPLGKTRARKIAKPLSIFLVYFVAPLLGFWAGLSLKNEIVAALAPIATIPTFFLAYKSFVECPRKGGTGIVSAFGNTIFLGIPAILSINGSLEAAVTYSMVTTFIHYSLAALVSCKKGKAQIQPFTFAFILGLILSPYSSLLNNYSWTKWLGAELSKLGLLILGLSFELEYLKLDKDVLKVGIFKHLVLPLLTLPFVVVSGNRAILVESTMPPAFMNIALAYVYGYDVGLVTKSVITLTLMWVIAFVPLSVILR